ncbi:MAG: 1-acyl-sn-glycerol-3-phosphate acyltransferase [Sphaerochaetaceae bacterium]|nr:1-acyl-sn-glycerol-3-phosphate acyltransferase [Sphaerochaetaceae bacterium]
MKILRVILAAVIVLPLMTVSVLLTPILYLFKKMKLDKLYDVILYFGIRIFAHMVIFLIGGRLHVKGKEQLDLKNKCYCYFANHQGIMDIVAMLYPFGIRTGFIGKKEIKKVPVVNAFFIGLGSVFLDRKNPRESIKAILKGSEYLKNGHSMSIYPEGTRSKDGKIHEFKAGSFKMATRVGATVVPVCIKGTRKLFEDAKDLKIHDIYLSYLKPIETKGMSEEELKALPSVVENAIRAEYDSLPALETL